MFCSLQEGRGSTYCGDYVARKCSVTLAMLWARGEEAQTARQSHLRSFMRRRLMVVLFWPPREGENGDGELRWPSRPRQE